MNKNKFRMISCSRFLAQTPDSTELPKNAHLTEHDALSGKKARAPTFYSQKNKLSLFYQS
jgi:hypothetical protein